MIRILSLAVLLLLPLRLVEAQDCSCESATIVCLDDISSQCQESAIACEKDCTVYLSKEQCSAAGITSGPVTKASIKDTCSQKGTFQEVKDCCVAAHEIGHSKDPNCRGSLAWEHCTETFAESAEYECLMAGFASTCGTPQQAATQECEEACKSLSYRAETKIWDACMCNQAVCRYNEKEGLATDGDCCNCYNECNDRSRVNGLLPPACVGKAYASHCNFIASSSAHNCAMYGGSENFTRLMCDTGCSFLKDQIVGLEDPQKKAGADFWTKGVPYYNRTHGEGLECRPGAEKRIHKVRVDFVAASGNPYLGTVQAVVQFTTIHEMTFCYDPKWASYDSGIFGGVCPPKMPDRTQCYTDVFGGQCLPKWASSPCKEDSATAAGTSSSSGSIYPGSSYGSTAPASTSSSVGTTSKSPAPIDY